MKLVGVWAITEWQAVDGTRGVGKGGNRIGAWPPGLLFPWRFCTLAFVSRRSYLMTGFWTIRRALAHRLFLYFVVAVMWALCASPLQAVVVISDGFGDADVNNNGTPLEPADVDVSGAGDGTVEPYIALGNDGTPMVYPMDTMVPEVTAVENAADVGIRWFSIGGFTSGEMPDPRASVHIISDAASVLPDTNPAIGYFHAGPADGFGGPGATRFATAIDDGLALAWELKGRGNAAAGFFNNSVELGPEINDEVVVSFDFRVWLSAPNFNDGTNINHVPAIGEIRFGLYQDTDNQLGMVNSTAGPGGTPATWGQANGNFRGDNGTVGAQGDHGWFVRLPIDDPENESINQLPVESVARINEELNEGSTSDQRIMNGATDFVAGPEPTFPFMDIDKVYNLSLSLKRFDDPGTPETVGDTIFATVTLTDRATGQQFSFGDFDGIAETGASDPDGGFESDFWDYFVMTTAGQSTSDDFDWLIDNFKVEVIGSNAPAGVLGDYNGNGTVDAADYVLWRNGGPLLNEVDTPGTVNQQDYIEWRARFGNTQGSGSSLSTSNTVPEPTGIVLLAVGGLFVAARRRRED
jgi:hypothetical protein